MTGFVMSYCRLFLAAFMIMTAVCSCTKDSTEEIADSGTDTSMPDDWILCDPEKCDALCQEEYGKPGTCNNDRCECKGVDPEDAGTDADADADLDVDVDIDADADSDPDQSLWQPLPESDTDCGEHCRQVSFGDDIFEDYDLYRGYLVYASHDNRLMAVDLKNMRQRLVYKGQHLVDTPLHPTVNPPWIYYYTMFSVDDITVVYRRHLATWEQEEISSHNYSEEVSPYFMSSRGNYLCIEMDPPVDNYSLDPYVECIHAKTGESVIYEQEPDMHMGHFGLNGDMISLFMMGSDLCRDFKILGVPDQELIFEWTECFADKMMHVLGHTGAIWEDYRHDDVESSGYNTDIYYLDLNTFQEKSICTDPSMQSYPATDGNLAVWADCRNSDDPTGYFCGDDVYMYNMDTGEEIRVTTGIDRDMEYLKISGKWVSFSAYGIPYKAVFVIDLESMGLYSEQE